MAFGIEMSLVVGCADDGGVSQEGEMPASVFVDFDSIQARVVGEGFHSHLSHEFIAPFRWSEEYLKLPGIDLSSRSTSAIAGSRGW